MQFIAKRRALVEALTIAAKITSKRTSIPILKHVRLETTANALIIAATDQQIGVRQEIAAEVTKRGAITTDAARLLAIVRDLGVDDVAFSTTDSRVTIKAGAAKFTLTTLPAEEFPAMPIIPKDATTLALPAAVLDMLDTVHFAISPNEERVNLCGVHLEAEPGELGLTATDGHRLVRATFRAEGIAAMKGILLPRAGIAALRSLAAGMTDSLVFRQHNSVVSVEIGTTALSMRLVEGEFPDWTQVVPKKDRKFSVRTDASALASALKRVRHVSSTISHGVALSVNEGSVLVASMNPDIGDAEETVESVTEGGAVKIGFNADYLTEALALMPDGARVDLGIGDELSPIRMDCEQMPGWLYVVMPMRL